MARRTVLLFSLFGLLNGLESPIPSVHECCQVGRTVAEREQDCSVLPRFNSLICNITQEHCCRSVLKEKACNRGIRMARDQRACERPFSTRSSWETQTTKFCCDCCTLGVKVANTELSCKFQGLQLGKQCISTAKMCCEQPKEVKSTVQATKVPQVFSTRLPEETNTCADTGCAQLCVGNGKCACYKGFSLKNDRVNCVDVDECLAESHNCSSEQVCINTEGSFRCRISCHSGFTLTDDVICNDINECAASPSPCRRDQTCVNTVGSYKCHSNTMTCPRGYRLSANGSSCEDVDECLIGKKCGNHICVNLEGTYRCECTTGYSFNTNSKLCQDINECMHYPGRLCAHNCENTMGSFQCSCSLGFKLAHDGRNCEDIDECERKPCSQECTNVYGSYQCFCRRGYQLSDIDGRTCDDIDECAKPNVCSYKCVNTPGGFNCTCPPSGYMLAQDGWTCQDIDECAAGTHSCSAAENCFNVLGGFRCFDFHCPPDFLRAARGLTGSASEVVRCVKSCQQHDSKCARNPTHIVTSTVLSLPTLRDLKQPEEIVFLRTATKTSTQNDPDVHFDITSTEKQHSFDVIKTSQNGMIVGVIRQVKTILGPKELVLKATIKYMESGTLSQQNIVILHIFISEFWF
ncbi:fibulin-1 [Nematolebias whitei]|uniref:fibulin-1 n=1 Tax=Nematolebias whitei TaxID=451745 RepID=UPI00189A295C|nr:fibulin-1 [Nematolebias whitei]